MLTPEYYGLFACTAILATATTWMVRLLAHRFGLVSHPNPIIPQHIRSVAYMGGVGVTAAAGIMLAILHCSTSASAIIPLDGVTLRRVAIPGLACLALGIADDLREFSARFKLGILLLIALLAVSLGVNYPFTGFGILDVGLSVFSILVFVNAFNLTDVCDGLLPGLSLIVFFIWAHLDQTSAPIAIAVSGAAAGFLFFNFPPATIFLGDAGSLTLGYVFAALALSSSRSVHSWSHISQVALLAAPFLFELCLLVIARRRKGLPWWEGSPDHFALRLQAVGLSRLQTNGIAWGATSVLCLIAASLDSLAWPAHIALLACTATAGLLCIRTLLSWEVPNHDCHRKVRKQGRHLLWIHQNFVSARQCGNSRPVHIIAALLDRGWSVDIITGQTGYLDETPETKQPAVILEEEGRLRIHRLRLVGGHQRRGLSWTCFFLKALGYMFRMDRVDVIYVSTPPPLQILLALILSVWKHAVCIYEVRDLWPALLVRLRLVRSRLATMGLEWLESIGYRYAEEVISVSPSFTGYLTSMGVHHDRLTVIPTGGDSVYLTYHADVPRAWRRDMGLQDKFLVIYSGSFNEYSGLQTVLDAIDHFDKQEEDVVWLFAGNGRLRPQVEAMARQHSHVRYLGHMPKDDLLAVHLAADLGLVALGSEPLLNLVIPGKLLDYLAAGLPIVSMADGLAGAIIRNAGAGCVLSNPTPEQLAETVRQFVRMPHQERKSQGCSGRNWVLGHMDCDDMGYQVVDVVESACLRTRNRSRTLGAFLACMGSVRDVLTRRSRRAVRDLLNRDLQESTRNDLNVWLKQGKQREQHSSKNGPSVPALLSIRNTCRADQPDRPSMSGMASSARQTDVHTTRRSQLDERPLL